MPRLVNRNPSYRKHRASGQAIITIDAKDIYLVPFGTQASRNEYDRVIGEWLANGRRLASGSDTTGDLATTPRRTSRRLCKSWVRWADILQYTVAYSRARTDSLNAENHRTCDAKRSRSVWTPVALEAAI